MAEGLRFSKPTAGSSKPPQGVCRTTHLASFMWEEGSPRSSRQLTRPGKDLGLSRLIKQPKRLRPTGTRLSGWQCLPPYLPLDSTCLGNIGILTTLLLVLKRQMSRKFCFQRRHSTSFVCIDQPCQLPSEGSITDISTEKIYSSPPRFRRHDCRRQSLRGWVKSTLDDNQLRLCGLFENADVQLIKTQIVVMANQEAETHQL